MCLEREEEGERWEQKDKRIENTGLENGRDGKRLIKCLPRI
jgi:hypothetical protein